VSTRPETHEMTCTSFAQSRSSRHSPIRRRQRFHLLIAQQAISIEDVVARKADVAFVDNLPSPDREDGDCGRVPETRNNPLTESGHGDSHGSILLALQLATFAPTDPKPDSYP
jgi:hypothetical protein